MTQEQRRVLAGRYEIGGLIGRGGMAEVHIGRDTRLSRNVAIKILRSDLARDPSFEARFRREAQSAASLNHPSIVAVYDTGEDVFTDAVGNEQRVPYIIMEYVEGHTVRDLLRDGAALPIDEAIDITSGVLSALEYAHLHGIVHRDIKPANVMLTPAGQVKVMDFGIARATSDTSGGMTATQAVVGTAQYLSPEQARGEVVDNRSDLYSTGCLLYELLTGRPPFVGESALAVAYQHVTDTPAPPSAIAPDVPEELDRITMKALAKDRTQRYATAGEFRADLQAAEQGLAVSAPAVTQVTQVVSAPPAAAQTAFTQVVAAQTPVQDAPDISPEEVEEPRRKAWPWVVAALVLLLVAGTGTVLAINRPWEATAEPTPSETTPTTVSVPDLSGLNETRVKSELEAAGLGYANGGEEASDAIPAGLVTSWTPREREVVQGSIITVKYSSGSNSLSVPNLTGMPHLEAVAKLRDLGFTVTPVNQAIDAPRVAQGITVRTEPAGGTVVPKDSVITIFSGTGYVELEDLTDRSEDEAARYLSGQGLTPQIETESSDTIAPGNVIRTEPDDSRVPIDSTVKLIIATAPPPPPTTPTTAPTDPGGSPSGGPSPNDGADDGDGDG